MFMDIFGWLKDHSYLATWLGPAIGITGLILNFTRKPRTFDLRAFTLYLTFFIFTGLKLSGFDTSKVLGMDMVWMVCFLVVFCNPL